MGTHTPWGISDYKEVLAPGIIWYGTPSHGGCHVAPRQNAVIHPDLRRWDGWYEEDLDWSIVAFTFPDAFPGQYERACKALRDWYPKAYTRVTGIVCTPENSYMLSKDSEGYRKWLEGVRPGVERQPKTTKADSL